MRGPRGVVTGRILGSEDIQGEIPGGRRPPMGAQVVVVGFGFTDSDLDLRGLMNPSPNPNPMNILNP